MKQTKRVPESGLAKAMAARPFPKEAFCKQCEGRKRRRKKVKP